VTQKKTAEKDGYAAVQLGFEDVKESKLSKPEAGHLKKAEVSAKKHLKEFRLKSREMNVGDEVKAEHLCRGDKVDVTGISKGHGFEGPVKRCGGHRIPMTHGGGPVHRQAGSMGSTRSRPGSSRAIIGAGQMGVDQVTVQNLDVVKVDSELNMLVVRGAIPGPKGGIVYLKNTVKNCTGQGRLQRTPASTRRRLPLVRIRRRLPPETAKKGELKMPKQKYLNMAGKQVGESNSPKLFSA
jgi:large subunit ribosomal protein L3